MSAAGALPPRFTFIGGHPLAGAARGGLEHARPDLFRGRPWLLSPPPGDAASAAVERLSAFVRALGAEPMNEWTVFRLTRKDIAKLADPE